MKQVKRGDSPLSKNYLNIKKSNIYSQIKNIKPKSIYLENFKRKQSRSTNLLINHQQYVIPTNKTIKYINAIYQGKTISDLTQKKQLIKHGQGILINNEGYAIIGTWNHNYLNGPSLVFFPEGGMLYCQYLNDYINGWSILLYEQKYIICQYYHLNKCEPQRYTYNIQQSLWIKSIISESKQNLEKIICTQQRQFKIIPKMISSQALISKLLSIFNENLKLDIQDIKHIKIGQKIKYVGFINKNTNRPNGFGVIYNKQEIYLGFYDDGELHQYGRILFNNGDIYQGGFKHGNFFGRGTYYNYVANTSLISIIDENGQKQYQDQFEGKTMTKQYVQKFIGDSIYKNEAISIANPIYNINKYINVWYHEKVDGEYTIDFGLNSDLNQKKDEKERTHKLSFQEHSEIKLVDNDINQYYQTEERIDSNMITRNSFNKDKIKSDIHKTQPIFIQKSKFNTNKLQDNYESVYLQPQQQNTAMIVPKESNIKVNINQSQYDKVAGLNFHYNMEKGELTFRKKATDDIDHRLKQIPSRENTQDFNEKFQKIMEKIPKRKKIFGETTVTKLNFI